MAPYCTIEMKLSSSFCYRMQVESHRVNCMVYLVIFEKRESPSCGRKISGREVKLETVVWLVFLNSGNQYRWIS